MLPLLWAKGEQSRCAVMLSELEYIPPRLIRPEELQRLCRFELTFQQLQIDYPYDNVVIEGNYAMTLEDLAHVIEVYLSSPEKKNAELAEWLYVLSNDPFDKAAGTDKAMRDSLPNGLPSKQDVFCSVFERLLYCDDGEEKIDYRQAAEKGRQDIQRFFRNAAKPLCQREYTLEEKKEFLDFYEGKPPASGTEELRTFWCDTLEQLCQCKDVSALKIKGEVCYQEGRWTEAEKYLHEGMEIESDAWAAYLLGMLALAGKTHKGIPQYEEAFHYFSISGAGGQMLAKCHLADLFFTGKGVGKDIHAAVRMIDEMYEELLQAVYRGGLGCMPEVAYRKGKYLLLEGQSESRCNRAYTCYLQAECLLEERMAKVHLYEDEAVFQSIQKAKEEVLPHTSYAQALTHVPIPSIGTLLASQLDQGNLLTMTVHTQTKGTAELTFSLPDDTRHHQRSFFVTIPEAHYCGRMETITVQAEKIERGRFQQSGKIEFDACMDTHFFLHKQWTGELKAQFFWEVPDRKYN
jgi:TPR repeat protein